MPDRHVDTSRLLRWMTWLSLAIWIGAVVSVECGVGRLTQAVSWACSS